MITQAEGAPNFFMRIFEMDPGVTTEPHSHDFEHEIYILEGEGYAVGEGDPKAIKAEDTLYISAMEKHTFRNDGPDKLCWICLIPAKVEKG
jgi:quercetin dioxygenase-like cupin family protein